MWPAIVATLTILGGVTAVVQLWKWYKGRRSEKGLNILLESLADKADAETAKRELSKLTEELRELRLQAPVVARRMHLEQRQRDLAQEIGRAWSEYETVSAELSMAPSADFPAEVIEIIRLEI